MNEQATNEGGMRKDNGRVRRDGGEGTEEEEEEEERGEKRRRGMKGGRPGLPMGIYDGIDEMNMRLIRSFLRFPERQRERGALSLAELREEVEMQTMGMSAILRV